MELRLNNPFQRYGTPVFATEVSNIHLSIMTVDTQLAFVAAAYLARHKAGFREGFSRLILSANLIVGNS